MTLEDMKITPNFILRYVWQMALPLDSFVSIEDFLEEYLGKTQA
jgi:hypothetical protein